MKKIALPIPESALFAGIAETDRPALLTCIGATAHTYPKTDIILAVGAEARFGMVLTGCVQILYEDAFGNRSILGKLCGGELFGETFACAGTERMPVSVAARTDCEILFFDYRRILTLCPSACAFHNRLVENMVRILAKKNVMLNQKIRYLSKRSTREKLLAYLSEASQQAGSKTFTIQFNRQELADYLCVERSGMSAELGKLRGEGVLVFNRSEFSLL